MENVCVDIDSLDDADHFFAFLNDGANLNDGAKVMQSGDMREAMIPVLCAFFSHGGDPDERFLYHLHIEIWKEFNRLRQKNKNHEEAFVLALWYWIKNANGDAFSWKKIITAMGLDAGNHNERASLNYYHIFKNCTGGKECELQIEGWCEVVGKKLKKK